MLKFNQTKKQMRLTVHLSNVKHVTEEVKTKEGMTTKRKIYNTLSYHNVNEKDIPSILSQVTKGDIKVTKHYLSY